MAIAVLVLLVIMIITLGCLLKQYKKRFLTWMHDNRRSLNALGDTTTVLWVTMQTLILVVQNHKESGGKDMPSAYGTVQVHPCYPPVDPRHIKPCPQLTTTTSSSSAAGTTTTFHRPVSWPLRLRRDRPVGHHSRCRVPV